MCMAAASSWMLTVVDTQGVYIISRYVHVVASLLLCVAVRVAIVISSIVIAVVCGL